MKNKINIYMFWLGENNPNKVKELNNKFKNLNFIIGPTEKEHNFLMKTVEYYKVSFQKKIYAFCSDVWRVYKLSKSFGYYIDSLTVFGRNFEKNIIDINENYQGVFIKEGFNYFLNGYLGSNSETVRNFYKYLFNVYKERENILTPYIFCPGPMTLTYAFMRFYNIKLNKDKIQIIKHKNEKFLFLSIHFINDDKYLINNGLGSWHKRKSSTKETDKNWIEINIKKWNENRRSLFYKIDSRQLIKDYPSVKGIRNLYDYSDNKKMNTYLLEQYKKIPNIKFGEKIFFSKLFRFFTLKWIKTK